MPRLSRLADLVVVAFALAGIVGGVVLLPKVVQRLQRAESGRSDPARYSGKASDGDWAKKIMAGGYILHFRHAERDKWLDVYMYDALESDAHDKGRNQSRMAENDYFKPAVCLNQRGLIQARAIGESLSRIRLPIGPVISSPSCRARQTAALAFGGYSSMNRDLVHAGPYSESMDQRLRTLRSLYQKLPLSPGKNTIISSHNDVLMPQMFVNSARLDPGMRLEEGGFYVISRDPTSKALTLEHEFHHFNDFIRHFYPR